MNRRALLGLKSSVARAGDDGAAPKAGYTRLATLTANFRRPDGRLGVMTVETGVDAPNPELAARITQSTPRLRAAYAAVVRESAAAMLPGTPPDVERLVVQLQAATDRVLGRRGARLLIGTVMAV